MLVDFKPSTIFFFFVKVQIVLEKKGICKNRGHPQRRKGA
jgi:hypothetical protein